MKKENSRGEDRLVADLNPAQLEAVTTLGVPQIIVAGAGSGKTRVLTRKLAWLVARGGYSPWNILAVTFTNKAAREMKERVEALLGEGCHGMWVSTFHSACLRVLREFSSEAGLRPHFTIYDEDDSKSLAKDCLKEIDETSGMPAFSGQKPSTVLEAISRAKSALLTPSALRDSSADQADLFVAEVYDLYQKKIEQAGAVDFDDIIMKAVLLLRSNPRVLQVLRGRFAYILVDEFQDTNGAQFELLRLLSGGHRRICAVGDDDQSIYKWRGADPDNMLRFIEEYTPHGLAITSLVENYRSGSEILRVANDIISNNFGRATEKALVSVKGALGYKPVHFMAASEREEAAFVASTVQALMHDEGYCYRDMAIFYRTHAQSRVLEEQFMRQRIPYRIVRGTAFYSRAEVKDIFSYLKLIENLDDDIALRRVINLPARGVGAGSLEKAAAAASMAGLPIFAWLEKSVRDGNLGAVVSKKAAVGMTGFVDFIKTQRVKAATMDLQEFFDDFMEDLGYSAHLRGTGKIDDNDRAENLDELSSMVGEFGENQGGGGTLGDFLEYVSLVSDVDLMPTGSGAPGAGGMGGDSNWRGGDGFVSLMTLHCAKGLEFRAVFMAGLEEDLFPHYNSYSSEEDMEEERRLCYVGVTRAMERLFLINTATRRIYGKQVQPSPSRFLLEIGPESVDREVSPSIRWRSW